MATDLIVMVYDLFVSVLLFASFLTIKEIWRQPELHRESILNVNKSGHGRNSIANPNTSPTVPTVVLHSIFSADAKGSWNRTSTKDGMLIKTACSMLKGAGNVYGAEYAMIARTKDTRASRPTRGE